jgi:hypothetical protein
MTAKEKAIELYEKYCYFEPHTAKRCALIAVDEMIKELEELLEGDERPGAGVYYLWKYYQEVKEELEKP